jgi:hypothetical protein
MTKNVHNIDAQIMARMKARVLRLLEKLEEDDDKPEEDRLMTIPQEISAIRAIYAVMIAELTYGSKIGERNPGSAGSAVRKYAGAFKTANAARRPRPNPRPAPPDTLNLDDDDAAA